MKWKTKNYNSKQILIAEDVDNALGKDQWSVDTDNPDKILRVNSDVSTEKIIEIVKSKGFNIEFLES